MSRQRSWKSERGFTLVEVMATIIVMGIVFAIASSTWFKVAESRRVDSATNQVVADLRLAHTQATNRLTDVSFVVSTADSSTYQVGSDAMPLPGDDQGTPKTKILSATNIVFKSDGRAITPAGNPPGDIWVAATDGDPAHRIQINSITSRIKVVS